MNNFITWHFENSLWRILMSLIITLLMSNSSILNFAPVLPTNYCKAIISVYQINILVDCINNIKKSLSSMSFYLTCELNTEVWYNIKNFTKLEFNFYFMRYVVFVINTKINWTKEWQIFLKSKVGYSKMWVYVK